MKTKNTGTSAFQKTSTPSAWIVNPQDRGRKSIKSGNKVYLNDGENFAIELFNPLTVSVLADIQIDGKKSSTTGLVLRPGERFYLDCFIDDRKKFVFSTYMVDNNNLTVEKAIAKNGLVEVFFYKEKVILPQIASYRRSNIFNPKINPYDPSPYWYDNTITCGNSNINFGKRTNINSTIDLSQIGTSHVYFSNTLDSNLSNSTVTYKSADFSFSDQSNIKSFVSQEKETGKVERGETSSQKFETVDMDFETSYMSKSTYQLFPESQKPLETKEVKVQFCVNCGVKLKGTENFCYGCGTKIK